MPIQTGPMCCWMLVCIHSPSVLLPPEHIPTLVPPLITCPQTPSFTLTPHPTSCHFTYITMDQTHISRMQQFPHVLRRLERESGHTHADASHVSFRSTEAQKVQIKGQFGISIWIFCKQPHTQKCGSLSSSFFPETLSSKQHTTTRLNLLTRYFSLPGYIPK